LHAAVTSYGIYRERPGQAVAERNRGGIGMNDRLIALVERRLYARPTSEDEARDALEWIARREGKTLTQLIEEIREEEAEASRAA
jgi:hypothetical protein